MTAHIIVNMAKNKKRSEIYRIFKKFNLRILVALFVLFVCLSIYGLRQNNINMINLKNQLMTADKDNGNVNGDLNKLRTYIYNHMNTSPSSSNGIYPPIQLKYTYQRLLTQAQNGITAQNTHIIIKQLHTVLVLSLMLLRTRIHLDNWQPVKNNIILLNH